MTTSVPSTTGVDDIDDYFALGQRRSCAKVTFKSPSAMWRYIKAHRTEKPEVSIENVTHVLWFSVEKAPPGTRDLEEVGRFTSRDQDHPAGGGLGRAAPEDRHRGRLERDGNGNFVAATGWDATRMGDPAPIMRRNCGANATCCHAWLGR